jgi:hypothetical protein
VAGTEVRGRREAYDRAGVQARAVAGNRLSIGKPGASMCKANPICLVSAGLSWAASWAATGHAKTKPTNRPIQTPFGPANRTILSNI